MPKKGEKSGEPSVLYQIEIRKGVARVVAYPCRRTTRSYIFDDNPGPGLRKSISVVELDDGQVIGREPVGRSEEEAVRRSEQRWSHVERMLYSQLDTAQGNLAAVERISHGFKNLEAGQE